MRLVVAALLVVAASAAAQPVAPPPACGICMRGNELIVQLGLEGLRAVASELRALELSNPLTNDQYARVVDLRKRAPVLLRAGAFDDADLAAVSAALCDAPSGECVDRTAHALRCLADRCAIQIVPERAVDDEDVLAVPETCKPQTSVKRTAPLGVGFEWGSGYQGSRYPADGRAWSFGVEARLRLPWGRRFGTVARVDRIAGRDAATDEDGDGDDDMWTGSITRISALAGPSIVFGYARFEGEPRFLRLDLLGGYVSTRSQPDESGPAAGIDLAYQLSVIRFGVRAVQAFTEDARDARMVLVHLGFLVGSRPPAGDPEACGPSRGFRAPRETPSRLALGFDVPLLGYGISSEHGMLTPSIGLELKWHLLPKLDALARTDLLVFPGHERERTIHSAALAGLRIDHAPKKRYGDRTGYFTTLMAGYTHGAGTMPTDAGSGPVGDISFGWGLQSDEAAAYLRLHGRFGLSPDNDEYRAVFFSVGTELRFEPDRWRDGAKDD